MRKIEKTLGRRLAELRRRRGLTQKELAEKVSLSVSFLSDVENDKRSIASGALLRIADVLDASLDYLMRGEEGARKREPLNVPGALAEAAEQEGWSLALTADLLRAQHTVVARRTEAGHAERPAREWTRDDWIRLYRTYFPDG